MAHFILLYWTSWLEGRYYSCFLKDGSPACGSSYIYEGTYLNEYLFNYGGHIGDGIRPSKRNMGYGNKMISLALDECRKLKIDKVLMVCNKNNIASRKTIIKNGGVLDNEVKLDNDIFERYWIKVNV